MSISPSPRQQHGHRRYRRFTEDPPADRLASHPTAMPSTSRETDVPSHRQSKKRSSNLLTSQPTWVILNGTAVRADETNGAGVTAMTSTGEKISVSFELMEPPRISLLTVDMPQRSSTPTPTESTQYADLIPYIDSILFNVNVIAAHRDVVLFEVRNQSGNRRYSNIGCDYFVYKASCGSAGRPSVSMLPVQYIQEGIFADRRIQHDMTNESTGILSTSNNDYSFIVADLQWRHPESENRRPYSNCSRREFDLHVLSSESNKWMFLENLHIRGANDGHDLDWWSTDAVVPYRSHYLIWVDYYRGLIVADMAYQEKKKPDLWFMPLPVDPPEGDPDHGGRRGCPEASRRLCVTSTGIKFVSIDHQRSTNFGVGHWKWTCTFRITTWSLRDNGVSVTWRKDARLYAEDLWALDTKNHFPHVTPQFPVVNMENPNALCFVAEGAAHASDSTGKSCMVEIDVKKMVLLAVTDYTKEEPLFSLASVKFSTELPRYLYTEESYNKRRH